MDPALLRQRSEFLKKASSQPSISTRPSADDATAVAAALLRKKQKKKTKSRANDDVDNSLNPSKSLADYSAKATPTNTTNAANFGTMAKIVDYMKKRHLNLQTWPLSLKEILEEVQVYDMTKRSEAWLKETLPKNRRLTVDADGKYVFKPPFRIKGKNSLLSVLKKYDFDGKGGVLLSELNECVQNADALAKSLGETVIDVPTQINKRKDRVYFYNDPNSAFKVDEEFRSIWRNVSVEHLDEKKIEEYLQKHGIDTMRDMAPKRTNFGPPKRKASKRKANAKVHNEHLSSVLEDYIVD